MHSCTRGEAGGFTGLLSKLLVGTALTLGSACDEESESAGGKFYIEPAAVMNRDVSFSNALYQTVGVTLQPGHDVEIVANGTVFDALTREISEAGSSVHILLYIWEEGEVSDRVVTALAERGTGVECRILVDGFGSRDFADTLQGPLEDIGCEVRIFRPLEDGDTLHRNHRKMVVLDGETAITGGFAIRDDWSGDGRSEGSYRDTHVVLRGPAVAAAQQVFAENWQEAGGALLPAHAFPELDEVGSMAATIVGSASSPVVTRAERLTQLMLASATRRVWIANAYFMPPDSILTLMKEKAAQGVDIRLLVPGMNNDVKIVYASGKFDTGELINHGARVWEYQPSMMHAKTMVVDDQVVTIGSINLDPMSFNRNDEVALVVDDADLNATMAASFLEDLKFAKELGKD